MESLKIISQFTSISSFSGALMSSPSTSSSSVCFSSPFASCVGGGSAAPDNHYHCCDQPHCQQNSPFKFIFALGFCLCILNLFFISLPVTAESGGCAFIFSSSSGTVVDCASSSTLKSHLRFCPGQSLFVCDHLMYNFEVQTLVSR